MGPNIHLDHEWKEKEELVAGELDRRMAAEEWSIGEEAQVKKRRVTGRESTTVG